MEAEGHSPDFALGTGSSCSAGEMGAEAALWAGASPFTLSHGMHGVPIEAVMLQELLQWGLGQVLPSKTM